MQTSLRCKWVALLPVYWDTYTKYPTVRVMLLTSCEWCIRRLFNDVVLVILLFGGEEEYSDYVSWKERFWQETVLCLSWHYGDVSLRQVTKRIKNLSPYNRCPGCISNVVNPTDPSLGQKVLISVINVHRVKWPVRNLLPHKTDFPG